MISSTTTDRNKDGKIKLWAVVIWLLLWQILSIYLNQEILLVSPILVFDKLCSLVWEVSFWESIVLTISKISFGFFLAFFIGIFLAILAKINRFVKELIKPMMHMIKAVPVASFIILCLVFISSKNLSVFISFLMVLPIIYTNTLHGIEETSKELLEMAKVFRIPMLRKIRYIYGLEVMPYIRSALRISLGLSFKAGIAAEVIGIPKGTIGERLYEAKIYLNTSELFAWTVVIVFVSIVFERLILVLLNIVYDRMGQI